MAEVALSSPVLDSKECVTNISLRRVVRVVHSSAPEQPGRHAPRCPGPTEAGRVSFSRPLPLRSAWVGGNLVVHCADSARNRTQGTRVAARELVQSGGGGLVGREIDEQPLIVVRRKVEGFIHQTQPTGPGMLDPSHTGRGRQIGAQR